MGKVISSIKGSILKRLSKNSYYFTYKGFCPCCDEQVTFKSEHHWLRDNFKCLNCYSVPRERALMYVIEKYYHHWRELSIHESSPVNRGASLKLKKYCNKYTASQYYPDKSLGLKHDDFINIDLEKQSFDDNSFDLVITQDVMEHIYEPAYAFKEIARTLRPGGAHIFSVPLINKHKKTEVWATKGEGGKPNFLHTPEFHGNPVNKEGSPVTMHWGFDIVEFIKKESGLETTIEHIDDLNYGIRAEYIEILISKKKRQ